MELVKMATYLESLDYVSWRKRKKIRSGTAVAKTLLFALKVEFLVWPVTIALPRQSLIRSVSQCSFWILLKLMVLSKLLHRFLWDVKGNCQNKYMDFFKLLRSGWPPFRDLAGQDEAGATELKQDKHFICSICFQYHVVFRCKQFCNKFWKNKFMHLKNW